MKTLKQVLCIAAIGIATTSSYAQGGGINSGEGPISEGTHFLYLGYGFPSFTRSFSSLFDATGNLVTGFGPFHAKYAYGFANGWTLGLNVNGDYASIKFNNGLSSSTNLDGSFNCLGVSFNVRANKALIQNDRFGLYTGAGFGYSRLVANLRNEGTQGAAFSDAITAYNKLVPVSVEATVGGIVQITPNICLYAEGGYAKSIVQFGIVFKQGSSNN